MKKTCINTITELDEFVIKQAEELEHILERIEHNKAMQVILDELGTQHWDCSEHRLTVTARLTIVGKKQSSVDLDFDDIPQLQRFFKSQRAGLAAKHDIALGNMLEFLKPLGEHVYKDDTLEVKEGEND